MGGARCCLWEEQEGFCGSKIILAVKQNWREARDTTNSKLFAGRGGKPWDLQGGKHVCKGGTMGFAGGTMGFLSCPLLAPDIINLIVGPPIALSPPLPLP